LNQTSDVVVLGAGVVGLMSAIDLAREGLSVTIVERRARGREASRAAGGILSSLRPWKLAPELAAMADESEARYPVLTREMTDATGIDPEWRRCGMLLVDSDQAIAARLWSNATGKRVEILDVNASVTLEPAVQPGSTPAIRMPDVAQIRNPRLMDGLGKLAELHGVRVVEYAGACGLFVRNGRCDGVITDEGLIRGDRVILSAGAWSGALLARVGIRCPVSPMRGQMIWYRVPRGTVEHIVIRDGNYLIPRSDGVLVVGSIIDEPGFAKGTTSEMTRELHHAATRIVPQLDRTPVRGQWSGLRPWCPDGLPYIGAAPEVERLFMCVGHHRNGMALAPASARLLVDIMLGRPPLVTPEPFDPRVRMAVAAMADL